MPRLETVNNSPAGPHIHQAGLHTDEPACPYCGQPISRKQFREIRARIEGEERARIAKLERNLQEKFAREIAQAESKKHAEIEKARKDVVKAAEAVIKQRLETERGTFAKKLAEAVNAEKGRAYQDRMKLDAQLQDLQRKLQRRTAGELGDEAEVDLLTELKAAFAADKITRVSKGVAGPDIIQEIIHNGTVCGTIIYDCKNHRRWLNRFTIKLRQDQLSAQADHAVLVAAVFPPRMQQLAVKDGIIIAAPQRVIVLAHLLRRQTIQAYALRLGNKARIEKAAKLYQFMTSDRAAHLWDESAQVTNEMLDLDRAETAAHQKTWARRAGLIGAVKRIHDDFSLAVDRIIGGTEGSL